MRRILSKTLIFSIFPILTLLSIFISENGTSDPFYQRFITGPKKSLIIGTSRAAQGIQPNIINTFLNLEVGDQLFNYSFTVIHSPYGEVYSQSILKKLNKKEGDDGVFIVCIDPWSLSSKKEDPNDISLFSEKGKFLERMWDVNASPNFQYLLNFYENSFYEIIFMRFVNSPTKLHSDGWLEINLKDISKTYPKILMEKKSHYLNQLSINSFSTGRFESFLSLIQELDKRGKVYLVRLPVDPEILAIDHALMPEFNVLMDKVSEENGCPYLDLTPLSGQFQYTDGNHLIPESSQNVSIILAKWIGEKL